jgi:putative phage-type endonuclease
MAARLLMTQDQVAGDRRRWKEIRRGGVTASEIAAVLGIAPPEYGSAFSVFTAKTTGEDHSADTDETRRGNHLEPYVGGEFQRLHDHLTVLDGGLYCAEDRPWQMATFDRLALDTGTCGYSGDQIRGMAAGGHPGIAGWPSAMQHAMPVQIKTSATRDGYGDPRSPDIPVHYRAQVLQEMDVAGADTAYVPVLFMAEWKIVTYVIERDGDAQADIDYMREAAEEFLDRVARDDPPPIDWTPATTRALKTLHPGFEEQSVRIPKNLALRYRRAQEAMEVAKHRLGQASNEVLARMGDCRWAVVTDGGTEYKVVTRSRYDRTTLSSEYIRDRHPDVAKAAEKKTPVDMLRAGPWAKGRTRG